MLQGKYVWYVGNATLLSVFMIAYLKYAMHDTNEIIFTYILLFDKKYKEIYNIIKFYGISTPTVSRCRLY